jgi:hypothetical protein
MQLGHKTGDFGKKSDGSVVCSLTVPIMRIVKTPGPGPTLNGVVNWDDDEPAKFAPNLLSYELTLQMFSGKSYSLTNKTKDPYEVVEIIREPDRLVFRPHAPSDF